MQRQHEGALSRGGDRMRPGMSGCGALPLSTCKLQNGASATVPLARFCDFTCVRTHRTCYEFIQLYQRLHWALECAVDLFVILGRATSRLQGWLMWET